MRSGRASLGVIGCRALTFALTRGRAPGAVQGLHSRGDHNQWPVERYRAGHPCDNALHPAIPRGRSPTRKAPLKGRICIGEQREACSVVPLRADAGSHPNSGGTLVGVRYTAPAVVLAALALGACSQTTTYTAKWQAPVVLPDQRTIHVTAIGSQCDHGSPRAGATETATEVRIVVRITADSGSCSKVGVPRLATVRLRNPLGTRRLLGCDPLAPSASCE